jgi:hypothetical protein
VRFLLDDEIEDELDNEEEEAPVSAPVVKKSKKQKKSKDTPNFAIEFDTGDVSCLLYFHLSSPLELEDPEAGDLSVATCMIFVSCCRVLSMNWSFTSYD